MADLLALEALFDAVVARFALETAPPAVPVPNLFGWREPAQKMTTGARILWIPGDPNGDLGSLLPATQPGRNPRSIATLDELFTVEILSHDATALENERAQYHATRLLFDAWFRAVYLAMPGRVQIVKQEWITDRKERRYGAAIRAVCAVSSMVPDAPYEQLTVDDLPRAIVDTELHDLIETDVIYPEPTP
jgi:hypothetical protein